MPIQTPKLFRLSSALLMIALSLSVLQAAELQYNIVNQWNTGFPANVKLINPDDSTINIWRLEFDYPYTILQI